MNDRKALGTVLLSAVAMLRQSQNIGSVAGLRLALESIPLAALVADDHAGLIAANAKACKLTGYSDRELRRLSIYDITGEPEIDNIDVLWRAFIDQRRQTGRFEIRTKAGRRVLVDYAASANVVPGMHLSLLRRVTRAPRKVRAPRRQI